MDEPNVDGVVACADLVDRAGGKDFTIGWDCPHTPDVPDSHNCPQVRWHAVATYRGARLMADGHQDPNAAAVGLAVRILAGGRCRCGETVSLADDRPGCRWRLVGQRWEPGCTAEPIYIGEGRRGDVAEMQRAASAHWAAMPNRAGRRRKRRG